MQISDQLSSDGNDILDRSHNTFSQKLGEMTWLLSQSDLHKRLSIGDLEWLLFPPLVLGQYKLFYANAQPIGLALWAFLTDEIANKLGETGRLEPNDWCVGFDLETKIKNLSKEAVFEEVRGTKSISNNTSLWLVDIIAMGATRQNKLKEILFTDLVQSVFKGQEIYYHQINSETGGREIKSVRNM